MTAYIYSTLSSDMQYAEYETSPGDILHIKSRVFVKGGAGVADKKTDTYPGFMTEVTDQQLDMLKKDQTFLLHIENGYIKIDQSKYDVDKAVKNMNKRDISSPKTPDDYKDKTIKGNIISSPIKD